MADTASTTIQICRAIPHRALYLGGLTLGQLCDVKAREKQKSRDQRAERVAQANYEWDIAKYNREQRK